MSGDHGFPVEVNERNSAGASGPRWFSPAGQTSKIWHTLELLPVRPFSYVARSSATSLAQPSTQQSPNLRDHGTDVFVLSIVQPLTLVRQPHIQTHLIQMCVG